jgi:hypothetical protein
MARLTFFTSFFVLVLKASKTLKLMTVTHFQLFFLCPGVAKKDPKGQPNFIFLLSFFVLGSSGIRGGSSGVPGEPRRCPRESKKGPRGVQEVPKGVQKRSRWSPRGAQGSPGEPKGIPRVSNKGPGGTQVYPKGNLAGVQDTLCREREKERERERERETERERDTLS